MNNTNMRLSAQEYQLNSQNFLEEIINAANKSKKLSALEEKFARAFYSYIPIDYIKTSSVERCVEFMQKSYAFLKNRDVNNHKISVEPVINHNNKNCLDIFILNDDKPFIVDSIVATLKDLQLTSKYFIHPILNVKRESDGELAEINKLNLENNNSHESLIYIRVNTSLEPNKIKDLILKISNTLNKVSVSTQAWPEILVNLDNCKKKLDDNSLQFINWLQNGHFVFFGYLQFKKENNKLTKINEIGINKNFASEYDKLTEQALNSLNFAEHQNKQIIIDKLNELTPIHRRTFYDFVIIKDSPEATSGILLLGLFTNAVNYRSVSEIPLISEKTTQVLDMSKFVNRSYNRKEIYYIIESLPRDFLFNIETEKLYALCMHILSSITSNKLKLFINKDVSGQFLNILIFCNKKRVNPNNLQKISSYLENKLGSICLENMQTDFDNNYTLLHLIFAAKEINLDNIDYSEIEQNIDDISASWEDGFLHALTNKYDEYEAPKYFQIYSDLFTQNYQNKHTPEDAIIDLEYIQQVRTEKKTKFNFYLKNQTTLQLKIYSAQHKQTLSSIMPMIENLGLNVIDENTYITSDNDQQNIVWLHDFSVSLNQDIADFQHTKKNVEEILHYLSTGKLSIDSLSKLGIIANLDWRQIFTLKALTRYLHQTGFVYGKGFVQLTLVKHAAFTKMLMEYFECKFNPEVQCEKHARTWQANLNEYLSRDVPISAEDKALRSLMIIIDAITRTNCYQKDNNGNFKDYISFKINSSKIPDLPKPVPYAEIFVFANDFEGIHLRGGKVARGGLRWSDRIEDYRLEVLGLMKAQMTKNSVIVPEGSKGGFIVRLTADELPRDEYRNYVTECYQNFIRGLLDLTDNLIDNKVTHPKNVVRLDEDDPYLVVAADKGTATFSDFANNISKEYNFWLGDAFASGGSVGYDHKKMGITAKGAWLAVRRHFKELGKDIQNEEFTVLGIGDMSGDVFGNGMLLSRKINLVAAFNHLHIFIDPNPDCEKSYQERERLFNTPGSKWTDYNPKLISKGGAVFARSAKKVELTDEIKKLVNTKADSLAPDELIKLLLKAEIDLIWNGGIGTYIKASTENNLEIGDKANDNLRVNGKDVKAKVVGEGGNLGVSMLGRIEFALNGGHINTDAVDNSAGVNCSDHEVNIKIALNTAVKNKQITEAARNDILAQMTDDVSKLVLKDNHNVPLALTFMQSNKLLSSEMYERLMKHLENENLLNREVESLPDHISLEQRKLNGSKLTRPELSTILAYSKMEIYNKLLNTKISTEPYFEKSLVEYFPNLMKEKFTDNIKNHPLRKEIITTIITNEIVNRLGPVSIYNSINELNANLCDIVRAYFIIIEIFDLENLWVAFDKLDASISLEVKINMFTEAHKLMRRAIFWFFKNLKAPYKVLATVEELKPKALKLAKNLPNLLNQHGHNKYQDKLNYYLDNNVPKDLAEKTASLDSLISAFDIIDIANKTGTDSAIVGKTYFSIGEVFKLDWYRKKCDEIPAEDYWQKSSLQSLKDDSYNKQRYLTKLISENSKENGYFEKWLEDNHKNLEYYNKLAEDIYRIDNIEIAMLILLNKRFEVFLQKI